MTGTVIFKNWAYTEEKLMTQRVATKLEAWVISVDMGYGHRRAAYPLTSIAHERIIIANNDKIISEKERRIWDRSRKVYEFVSRMKNTPILGSLAFGIYERIQDISPLFPLRNLSKPNFATLSVRRSIKKGLCKSLIQYTQQRPIPIITTHFIPALAYHYAGQPCYCVVTDTDINRVWVPDDPQGCHITYCSPCTHTTMRLREYGVPETHIIETGFPLPGENIGRDKAILKRDLFSRLINLDPSHTFFAKYEKLVQEKLCFEGELKRTKLTPDNLHKHKNHALTLMYLVGGSGAEADIGVLLLASLKQRIINGEIRVILSAGTRLDVKEDFETEVKRFDLQDQLGRGVVIVFAFEKKEYFVALNQLLRTTDILWTKPSELSFYTALGLPIIIAPPIGSQENFNREWLEHIGSGFVQENPAYVNDWLFYWVNDGRLAEAALHGFLNAPSDGTAHILECLRAAQRLLQGRNL